MFISTSEEAVEAKVGLETESEKAAKKLDENDHLYEALKSDEFLRARSAEVALNPKQRIPFTLVEHCVLSPDRCHLKIRILLELRHMQTSLNYFSVFVSDSI